MQLNRQTLSVMHCMHPDLTRYAMSGVHVDQHGFTATDGTVNLPALEGDFPPYRNVLPGLDGLVVSGQCSADCPGMQAQTVLA